MTINSEIEFVICNQTSVLLMMHMIGVKFLLHINADELYKTTSITIDDIRIMCM